MKIDITPAEAAAMRSIAAKLAAPEPPAPLRYFGYYLADDPQIAETRDHVNLLFEGLWRPMQDGIARVRAAKMATILEIDDQVYTTEFGGHQYVGDAECRRLLRELFDQLRADDTLKYIVGLAPRDEPDLSGIPDDTQIAAINGTRMVLREYPELMDCAIVSSFTGLETYPEKALPYYDIIGPDDYGRATDLLKPGGKADRLRTRLLPARTLGGFSLPAQRMILFPGGCEPWREDPAPFIAYANLHPEVIALVAFMWWTTDADRKGIRENGMADAYRRAGLKFLRR